MRMSSVYTLAQAQHEIESGFFPDVNPEADKFEELLGFLNDEDKNAFAQWVYGNCGKCYVGTRRAAALRLMAQQPEDFMRITRELIVSNDPFDRDSAFCALCDIDDPRRFEYLRILLDDDYLQFSAIDYMYQYFPDEILSKLRELDKSSDKQIRNLVAERLSKFLNKNK